jgi:hypothetical protein
VQLPSSVARDVAFYQAALGTGILAPRGGHCLGLYGSSGSSLIVTPQAFKSRDYYSSGLASAKGQVIVVDHFDGGTAGRFEVAEVIARVFPGQRAFVEQVIKGFPDTKYTFGPYPADKLIVQTDRLVQFETPPHSEGLGTRDGLEANGDPVEGVAILHEEAPDLLMLRVRLPKEQRDLAPVIIHDLLVREGGDAR